MSHRGISCQRLALHTSLMVFNDYRLSISLSPPTHFLHLAYFFATLLHSLTQFNVSFTSCITLLSLSLSPLNLSLAPSLHNFSFFSLSFLFTFFLLSLSLFIKLPLPLLFTLFHTYVSHLATKHSNLKQINVGPLYDLFDHLLWSIFQSSYTSYHKYPAGPLRAAISKRERDSIHRSLEHSLQLNA